MTKIGIESSTLFKFYSPKGTMLGHIIIPDEWRELLTPWGKSCRFYVPVPLTLNASTLLDVSKRIGTLYPSPWGKRGEALVLYAVSLEEFEQVPGCAFFPSAGYLRTLVE